MSDPNARFIPYEEAFHAFLDRTNEKWATATVLDDFFRNFAREGGFDAQAGRPLTILDLGCADGGVAADLIRAASHAHEGGFDYTGFDISDAFVQSAQANVGSIDSVVECRVVKTANAFSDARLFARRYDIILISHSLYYLDDRAIGDFLVQVQRALMPDGLAILFHESHDIGWSGIAVSHGENVKDYSAIIAEQAAFRRLPLVDLLLYTKIDLPALTPAQRKDLRGCLERDENPSDLILREMLSILAFLVYQSDRNDLGQLIMPALVNADFADDMLRLADENGGTIPTFARMQIIPAPGADALFGKLQRTMDVTDCDSARHEKSERHG